MRRALKLSGCFELVVIRKGTVIHRDSGRNLVTDYGEEYAADRFAYSTAVDPMRYLALGDDDTLPDKSDTELGNEIAGTRTDRTTDAQTGNSVVYDFTYTHAGASITVKEAGIFDAAAAGNMACRFLTRTFDMAAGDELDLSWSLTFEGVD